MACNVDHGLFDATSDILAKLQKICHCTSSATSGLNIFNRSA